jgi:hypothetical protein
MVLSPLMSRGSSRGMNRCPSFLWPPNRSSRVSQAVITSAKPFVSLWKRNQSGWVSRFTPETLADAHAAWRSRRGTPTTAEEAAKLLESHLVDGWDPELLTRPRIALLAGRSPER